MLVASLAGCSNKDNATDIYESSVSQSEFMMSTDDEIAETIDVTTPEVIIDPEHVYITEVVDPTCEENGYTMYFCGCGDTYVEDEVDAYGHDYISNVVLPTVNEKGFTEYTCVNCNDKYKDNYVDKLTSSDSSGTAGEAHTHKFEKTVVAPTCTKKGYTISSCSCGQSNIDDGSYVDATGHKYEETIYAPTCTKQGYTSFKCKTCGSSYNDNYVNSTGHKYEDQVTKEATCTATGIKSSVCTGCGYQDTSKTATIQALGHDYSSSGTIVASTCTDKGYTSYKCSRCSDIKKDSETAALGHSYKISSEKAPGCENAGSKTYTCTRCNNSYNETINATGHSTAKVEEIAPSCNTCGKTNTVCTACSKTIKSVDNASKPALGHDWKESSNTATCTANGTKTYKCNRCSETKSESSAATGHGSTHVETKNATCTENGWEKTVCDVCGSQIGDSKTLPANGSHSWETAVVSTAAKDYSNYWGYPDYDRYIGYSDIACDRCKYCYDIDEGSFRIKYSQSEIANIMLGYINALRRDNGLNDLTISSSLNNTAGIRAEQISISFAHGPGIENITNAGGVSNCIKRAYDAFYNSAAHKAAMLTENISYFGCGIYYCNGRTYCVQLFG